MKMAVNLPQILLLCHVFLVSILLPSTQCSDLVDQTCKKTPHYDICVSSLRSVSQSSNADVEGLASIMVSIVLEDAKDTLNYIQELIKQTTDQQVEQSLAYCAELYIPVVKYTIPQAMDALSGGQYAFANDGISDAGKEADGCQKKFTGSNESLLADRNKLVRDLSDVAVAIVNMLRKG